jgi:YD repeat-containing protein
LWVDNFNRTDIFADLQNCAVGLASYLETNHAADAPEQVLGGKVIISEYEQMQRLSGHPDLVGEPEATWAREIPNVYRTKITISLSNSTLGGVYYADYLYGRALAVLMAKTQHFFEVPVLYRMVLDGEVIASVSQPNTRIQNSDYFTIYIDHPYISDFSGLYMDEIIQKRMSSGVLDYVFVFGFGNTGSGLMRTVSNYTAPASNLYFPPSSSEDPADWESYDMGLRDRDVRGALGASYIFQSARTQLAKLLSQLSPSTIQHHHSVGFISTVGKTIADIETQMSVVQHDGGSGEESAIKHTLAALLSGFEAQIMTSPTGFNAVSNVNLLARNVEKIYEATSSNWSLLRPLLDSNIGSSFDLEVLDNVDSFVAQGYKVYIAEKPVPVYTVPMENSANGGEGVIYVEGSLLGSLPWNFLAVDASGTSISHMVGRRKGTVIGTDDYDVLSRSLKSLETSALTRDYWGSKKISLLSGEFSISVTDLVSGGGNYPYSLPLIRTYSSALSQDHSSQNSQPFFTYFPTKWTHNYEVELNLSRDPVMALGGRAPLDATHAIVTYFTVRDVLGSSHDIARRMVAVNVFDWMTEQMVNNAASMRIGNSSSQFSRPPYSGDVANDLEYIGPQGGQGKLIAGSASSFNQFWNYYDGRGVKYSMMLPSAGGTLASFSLFGAGIQFPFGVGITIARDNDFSGNGANQKIVVANSLGRKLTIREAHARTSDSTGTLKEVYFGWQENTDLLTGLNGANVPTITSVTNAAGKITNYAYDPDFPARLTKIIDPLGNDVLSIAYDYDNRVKSVTNANNQTWKYYISGRYAEVVDPLGNSTITYHDDKGRPFKTYDPLGRSVTTEYDDIGRVASVTRPDGNRTEYDYDSRHNVVTERQVDKTGAISIGMGATYLADCTPATNPVCNSPQSFTDANGNTTILAYDFNEASQTGTGNLMSTTAPATAAGMAVIQYQYNAFGQLITAIDPLNMVTALEYDGSGNLISTAIDVNGANLKTIYFFDSNGNMCREVGPRGSVGLTGGVDPVCDQ